MTRRSTTLVIAANLVLTAIILVAVTGIAVQVAKRATAQPVVAAPQVQTSEVRLRRRHQRARPRPRAAPEPGVAPFDQNVILEPELKTVRTIEVRRWSVWCDRVGGLEC